METENKMENRPPMGEESPAQEADRVGQPEVGAPKGPSAGSGHYKGAAWCFVLGALSILSKDSGLISLWEGEVGLLLILGGILLAVVGLLRAHGIE